MTKFLDYSLTSKGILKYFFSTNDFQWKSEDYIKNYQYLKLKKLLTIAGKNVSYYKKLFKELDFNPQYDFKISEDLKNLPILSKKEVRKNPNNFINKSYLNKSIQLRTSGSTGNPMEIYCSYNAWVMEQSVIWRHWSWAGYKFRDPMGILRSYAPGPDDSLIRQDKLRNFTYFSPFHLDIENMFNYHSYMVKNNIQVLRGYPSSLYIYANFLDENNLKIPNVKFILSASEVLKLSERSLIEKVFETKIYDHYGLADISVMMGECEMHQGLHNYEDYGYLELKPESGLIKIIGTNLNNYAMPLIRYDTGDLSDGGFTKCSCGRNFPLIKSIKGRKDSVIILNDKIKIPTVNFYTMFDEYLNIKKWQIVQEKHLIKFIILSKNFEKNQMNSLKMNIEKRLRGLIDYKIIKNGSFYKTGEGKIPTFFKGKDVK